MAIDWEAYRKKAKEKDAYNSRMMRKDFSKLNKEDDDIAPVVIKKVAPTNILPTVTAKSSKDDDIAPVITKEEKDNDRTWFKKSKGSVGQAILGSIADVGENIGSGIIGMGEKAVDTLAMLGTALGNAQMSQLAQDEMAYKALTEKKEKAGDVFDKYQKVQQNAKKGASEFVAKDLYNEEEIAKKIITAPFENRTGINVEDASVFGEKSDALIQSGGQLLATAGLQAVGVPWFLTTGVTSFGAEAENALKEGATFEDASMSAAISTGAEILSEKLFGGIKFGGKTLDDVVLKPFVEKISNKAVKTLVNLGVDAVGEGAEEVFSSVFSRLGSALYKEESIGELLTSEEAADEYLESFIGGAVLGGMSGGVKAVAGRNNTIDEKQQKDEENLTENEQKVVDKVVEERIAEKTKDGKKLTKKEEAQIRKAVLNDLQKGYIATDTIESVLGGETYKTYKDTVDNETALQNEFDSLNKMKQGDMTGEQIDRRAELKQRLAEIKNNSNVSQLKNQLSNEVSDLVKDSRLAESYNEKSRRGQKFEADLTKYKGKQLETVKRAVESGILNNTNRTHEFVDMIAKISADKGVLFDFTSSQKLKESGFAIQGKMINGLITAEGNIAVNVNSAKALNSVVGHEITHVLKGTELYKALQKSIIEYAKTKGEYQARFDEISKLYEGIEGANIENELTAELVGDYLFTDSDFISRLSTENRNVFQKVYDEIKYLCKIATADSKEARELEKVKRAFEKAYRENKNTTGEGGVNTKYSLSADAESELHKALYDKNYRSEVLLRDETPSIMLSQKGVKNHKMVMNASHIRENVFTEAEARNLGLKVDNHTHYHGIGEEYFLKIIDSLDNVKEAYRGTKNASDSSRRENYFLLVTEFKDTDGNIINVPVFIDELAQCNRVFIQTNKIATVFGRDNFREYINRQIREKNLIRINNKSNTFSEGDALIAPAYESTALIDSIPNSPENVKQKQLEIIEKVNPAPNTYNTWIRKIEDIKTLAETLEDSDWADGDEFNPDLTREMIEEAIESGEITVYSSYPIEQGVFVSPSYMEAASYSGDGNVYEKTVSIDEVAWIDPTQGMYANAAESYSLTAGNTTPKKYGDYNVYGEEVMLQSEEDIAPVRADIKNNTPSESVAEDIGPMPINAEPVVEAPIATVKQKLSAKLQQSQTELFNNQRLQEKSNSEFDKKIAEVQTEYNAKKNKNTKAANDLLRRIETLKRRKSNINADYAKRISDIESRISRLEVQLLSNHNKADRLERFKKREAKRLDADKKFLTEEFEQRKAKLQEEIKDKNSFISNKALGLYKELNGLKKGVRASEELGYFLDHGFNWSELKSTLLKVSKWPDVVINPDSEVESVVREAIGRDYEERQYELHDIDNALDKRIEQLEADAQKKLEDFKVANRRISKQNEFESQMEDLIGDTSTWVDKKLGLQYKVNTLRRNLRDIVRDAEGKRDIAKADAIYDELQGKYNHNEAELNREANRIKQQFAEMKITKAEDVYIQMLGELRHNPDTKLSFETVEEFYEEHQKSIDKDKVDKVIKMARPVYDDLLLRVNKVLSEHGMKEIPYRKGYFPHFTEEKQGFLAKLLNWKTQKTDIPTDIAGLTENSNPNRSWQSFNKHRVGDDTIYSFTKGLDRYVQGSLDWIYHIEDIQKRRAFEHHIRYVHSEQGIKDKIDAIRNSEEYDAETAQEQIDLVYREAGNPLNNFVSDFRTATNTLAGKKSSMDRGTEKLVNRKIYSTMTNISNRVSANMVAGSVSSALTNFIPITQSWVEVSPVSSLRAMKDTIASIIRDDGTINKSDFLTNRLNKSENLYKTNWDKIGKGVSILMDVIDNFTAQTVWRSKYIQNMSKGMSESQAIKNADQFASNVMADRSRGNQPTIFDSKSPVSKIFTAFQLEVNNQYGYFFKDAPQDIVNKSKARLICGYATAFIGAYAYNALYSYLTGRDAAFDPIGIIEELMKDIGFGGDDEEEEIAPVDVVLNLTNNILEEVPFVSGLLGGGRIPISSALPYGGIMEAFEGTLKDSSEGNLKTLTKEWLNPVYYLALPMGGGQLKKSIEGAMMFSDKHPIPGSYTDSGNLRFPVDDTLGNRVQAGIFGQYANANARDYFGNERSPLKEKQIQEFIDVDIPIADYWKYREDLKELDSLEDKFDFVAGMDLPVEKKNILINNIVDRKEKVNLENYDDFENYEEFDFYVNNTDKYKFLASQGVSYKNYKSSTAAKENYDSVYSWYKNNPDKVTLAKAVTDNVIKYRGYARHLNDIKADKDSEGNTIAGSAKEKKKEYIWSLDIDEGAKCILFKSEYKTDDTYNYEIIDYLNSREDISGNEMKTILEELGFVIDDEGYIAWD